MSTIYLSKKNLFHNLDKALSIVKEKSKIAPVLKDNAYGHGLVEMASLLKEYGISKAVVRTCDDAERIKKFFPYILVLADTVNASYSHNFHIALNDIEQLSELPVNTNIHINCDTGMHRNGIRLDQLESCIHGAFERKLNITGLFTHFASADMLTESFAAQNEMYSVFCEKGKKICEKLSLPVPSVHSCNTPALFRTKNFSGDFVRIGTGMYGYCSYAKGLERPDLKPVLSLETNLISSRILKKGQKIGYGETYEAKKDMQVGTYDIGYGQGFPRLDENKVYHTPDGYRLLGKVSMDYVSLDTNEKKVILFNNVSGLAALHKTITIQATCALSPFLKRVIIE